MAPSGGKEPVWRPLSATFAVERDTKNTVRFAEELESEFAAPIIGQVYIPKSTLGALGFSGAEKLVITIALGK